MSVPNTMQPKGFSYKPPIPGPVLMAVGKMSDEELWRKGPDETLRTIRKLEGETRSMLMEQSNVIKDVNRRLQIHLLENRGLKDVMQKFQSDNQELRDLCCFLDDDRQRGRKLAREWQRFGRYTATVMRSEVSTYQDKLKDLEGKQEELLSSNTELKELCLYLDHERTGRPTQDRDDGDGSSNGTLGDRMEEAPETEERPRNNSSSNVSGEYHLTKGKFNRHLNRMEEMQGWHLNWMEEMPGSTETEKRQLNRVNRHLDGIEVMSDGGGAK